MNGDADERIAEIIGRMDRWMDGWMDEQIEGQFGGWIEMDRRVKKGMSTRWDKLFDSGVVRTLDVNRGVDGR